MTAALTTRRPRTARPPLRFALAALVLALGGLTLGPVSHPAPAAAATSSDLELQLLNLINAERERHGLVKFRKYKKLVTLAGDRADYMASTGQLAHISCLSCTLNARGIQWYYAGEVIATTSYPWGSEAVKNIFNMWMGSSGHRAILLSDRFNYIGLGVAYRGSNATTWAAGVLTESKDRTKPWIGIGSGRRSGDTITWTWRGGDRWLQTHTAGLDNYDVQYRVGSGTWKTIRSGTTATSLTLTRGSGTYGVRVRSRDNRGYLSVWSAEVRITVP